ncbi:MAG: hypothetical protein ACNA8R_08530 [Nitriliruptoraceae bacterium]
MAAVTTTRTDSAEQQRLELAELLRRFETSRRDELAALCGSAGDSVQRLADRGQVPGYLVVEPQDPAPVVERTVLAVLRRLSGFTR